MKKISIFIIIALFAFPLVVAQTENTNVCETVVSPLPEITYFFEELVSIVPDSASFYTPFTDSTTKAQCEVIPYYDSEGRVTSSQLICTPEKGLINAPCVSGNQHIFSVTVRDVVMNEKTLTQEVGVSADDMSISIQYPPRGVFDLEANLDTTLTIQTKYGQNNEDSQCAYVGGTANPNYDWNKAPRAFGDGTTWQSTHNKIDFWMDNLDIVSVDEFGNPSIEFWTLCLDSIERPSQKKLSVFTDIASPVISAQILPSPILDSEDLNPTIIVNGNEPVLCKYAINTPSPNYNSMNFFSDFTQSSLDDVSLYEQEPRSSFQSSFPAPPPGTTSNYTINVQCKDRAWKESNVVNLSLEIDLARGPSILSVTPLGYIKDPTIIMNVTTSKRAICKFSDKNGTFINQPFSLIPELAGKGHFFDFKATLLEGVQTFDISCTALDKSTSKTHSFTIDRTKPDKTEINGTPIFCDDDEIDFPDPLELTAEDTGGVDYFEYAIPDLDINWTKGDNPLDKIKVDNDNLSEEYSLKIRAVDKVGLEGAETTIKIKLDPEDYVCLEHDPPIVRLRSNETTGLNYFTCIDESGCDYNTFVYGYEINISSCSADSNYAENSTFAINVPSYVCWNVSDVNGEESTGYKFVNITSGDTCSNSYKDSGEADVDCGGTCSSYCPEGQGCFENSDCDTNYCFNSVCTASLCDDTLTNGFETDEDCGGKDCGGCEVNLLCERDSDCSSSFCNPNNNTCQIPTCTDFATNGNETDEDCGGNECFGCEKAEQCNVDSDCLSENCNFGRCSDLESAPVEEEGSSSFSVSFLVLILAGLFLTLPTGYLVYENYYDPKKGSPGVPPILPHPSTKGRFQKPLSHGKPFPHKGKLPLHKHPQHNTATKNQQTQQLSKQKAKMPLTAKDIFNKFKGTKYNRAKKPSEKLIEINKINNVNNLNKVNNVKSTTQSTTQSRTISVTKPERFISLSDLNKQQKEQHFKETAQITKQKLQQVAEKRKQAGKDLEADLLFSQLDKITQGKTVTKENLQHYLKPKETKDIFSDLEKFGKIPEGQDIFAHLEASTGKKKKDVFKELDKL